MTTTSIDPVHARVALRALKMVALASNGLHEAEAGLLRAAAGALRLQDEPDTLAAIEPEETAATITDELGRTRLIEAMMLMALMDQEVDAQELEVIDRFASALGIDEPRLKNLHQFVDGHTARMKLDVVRRSYFTQYVLTEAWKEGGIKGVWKAFAPRFKLATDPELAWRYKQLGLLPEGSLGRTYWAHCTERKFSLPGEPGGFPWQVVHDMGHVLGGHDTDPHGEIEQAAFEAGYMKRDPFFLIFTTTMMFHVGVAILGDDYIGHTKGAFNPADATRAYERGLACNTDLTSWDYWPHVGRPLDEVCRELEIPSREKA